MLEIGPFEYKMISFGSVFGVLLLIISLPLRYLHPMYTFLQKVSSDIYIDPNGELHYFHHHCACSLFAIDVFLSVGSSFT